MVIKPCMKFAEAKAEYQEVDPEWNLWFPYFLAK